MTASSPSLRSRGRALLGATLGRLAARVMAAVPPTRLPRRAARRDRTLVELRPEVTALALAGVPTAEIARRTGLAHDAVGLILHLAAASRREISAGLGTMCRPEADARPAAARA